ncbi:MAG: leishmanolysin-related zinc metalloendopeptidase [Kiritimatiellales bacterium]
MKSTLRHVTRVLCLIWIIFSEPAYAAFSININGLEGSGFGGYQSMLDDAAAYWQSIITGYQWNIQLSQSMIDSGLYVTDANGCLAGVNITAGFAALGTGVLGQAGPRQVVLVDSLGVMFSGTGVMMFSTAYYSSNDVDFNLYPVILHEMAHILGFGTLWSYFYGGITYNDVLDANGNYIGANALNTYRIEFNQPGAAYIPVETNGGKGTAGSHWLEVEYGAADTGIVSIYGEDMRYELMTGWANDPMFTSMTTIASFADMGYTVVPEPVAILMVAAVGILFGLYRRFFNKF